MVEAVGNLKKGTKYNVVILGRAYAPRSNSAAQYKGKVREGAAGHWCL